MKRERKRTVRNYDCYDEYDCIHYGLIVKKGKLRIDVKRMSKCFLMPFDSDIIERMNQIPRNTQYFFPKKIKRHEYMCNIFKDYIDYLQ